MIKDPKHETCDCNLTVDPIVLLGAIQIRFVEGKKFFFTSIISITEDNWKKSSNWCNVKRITDWISLPHEKDEWAQTSDVYVNQFSIIIDFKGFWQGFRSKMISLYFFLETGSQSWITYNITSWTNYPSYFVINQ